MKRTTSLFRFLSRTLCVALVAANGIVAYAGNTSPFDSLTAKEMTTVTKILRSYKALPVDAIFGYLDVKEPDKAAIIAGKKVPRLASAVLFSKASSKIWEADVDIGAHKVVRFDTVKDQQAMVQLHEYDIVSKVVHADLRWQEAMKKRGIKDFDKVQIDGWAAGSDFGAEQRVMRALSFYKGSASNYYSRPIEGVVAVVDLSKEKVIELIDTGVVPIADKNFDLDKKSTLESASARGHERVPKPLVISQPQGADFRVDGWEVSWMGWRFHMSFHGREGLVLHQVTFDDHGQNRQILYRANLSEMVVPYGDPAPTWNWRAAFDVGEYGFGILASPLEPGQDVPSTAKVFDATMADAKGMPHQYKNVMAIHERDGGIIWKHYDKDSGKNDVRRTRELVVTSAAAVGNYDYIVSWIFRQDASLDVEVMLSGILLGKGTQITNEEKGTCAGCTGHLVSPNIFAPNHQHFLNFRLDFDVDGASNSVTEMNQHSMGVGPLNPKGNGFVMAEEILKDETAAQRDLYAQSNRRWRIINPNKRNSLGNHTGYMLMPKANTQAYLTEQSPTLKRAAFVNHAFWATRYHPTELNAAGAYPNQANTDSGLSRWANDGESLESQDIVVWYTMGISHAPSEEEWPIMNVHRVGFSLVPTGFFAQNPSLHIRN